LQVFIINAHHPDIRIGLFRSIFDCSDLRTGNRDADNRREFESLPECPRLIVSDIPAIRKIAPHARAAFLLNDIIGDAE
jgi:hypothetical protein